MRRNRSRNPDEAATGPMAGGGRGDQRSPRARVRGGVPAVDRAAEASDRSVARYGYVVSPLHAGSITVVVDIHDLKQTSTPVVITALANNESHADEIGTHACQLLESLP